MKTKVAISWINNNNKKLLILDNQIPNANFSVVLTTVVKTVIRSKYNKCTSETY